LASATEGIVEVRRSVKNIEIVVPRHEVLRLLGMHKKRRRAPRDSMLKMIDEECAAARKLLRPRGVVVVSEAGLPGSRHFAVGMPLAVVVCTIGVELENLASRYTTSGDCARAMVLDAVGSVAVEEVANHTNHMICDFAAREGSFAPEARCSPGYGGWSLDEQRLIFDLVSPYEIGVALSAGCMMTPQKSISYAVPLRGGRSGQRSGGRCVRCGFADCQFRDERPGEIALRH
jgi:hypothetical protein